MAPATPGEREHPALRLPASATATSSQLDAPASRPAGTLALTAGLNSLSLDNHNHTDIPNHNLAARDRIREAGSDNHWDTRWDTRDTRLDNRLDKCPIARFRATADCWAISDIYQ